MVALFVCLLFHVQFQLLLLDLHTGFLGGRSGGLVAPIFRHYIFSKKGIGRLKERSVFKYLKDYHVRGRLDLYFGFYKFNQKQGSHKRALVWKSNRPEYTSTGPCRATTPFPVPPSTGSHNLSPAFLISRAGLFLDAWDLENVSMEIKILAWIS